MPDERDGRARHLEGESWLQYLELTGSITRVAALHGPIIGAALYTTLHLLVFYFLRDYAGPRREAKTKDYEGSAP